MIQSLRVGNSRASGFLASFTPTKAEQMERGWSHPHARTPCRAGVFGAHSAMVVRRLRRLCARLYGSNPTFAVTTATVANPEEHAARLLGSQEVHGELGRWRDGRV